MICPGITPMTCKRDDVVEFVGITNIFESLIDLMYMVFCRKDDDEELLLLLRTESASFLILLTYLLSILFPSRNTSEILKDSKSSNKIKSALNPGPIAPKFFNPKYLAVLIDAICIALIGGKPKEIAVRTK